MRVNIPPGYVDVTPGALGDLQVELYKALDELALATKAESIASNRTCAARNAVSDVQKKIDAIIKDMRTNAPRSTSWADDR